MAELVDSSFAPPKIRGEHSLRLPSCGGPTVNVNLKPVWPLASERCHGLCVRSLAAVAARLAALLLLLCQTCRLCAFFLA